MHSTITLPASPVRQTAAQPFMQPMGLGKSLLYFGIPTLLMYLATHIGIPLLERSFGQYLFGQPLLICWFISGGAVFMLLFVAALVCYRRDGHPWQASALIDRFGLTRPTLPVLGWTLLGMVAIGGLSYGILKLGEQFVPGYTPQPPFMKIRPLAPSETWLLLFWLPLFFFNILGEGFFWRGYIFPRQRLAFGSLTWLVHAGCWTLFHLPFGLGMISAALPILVIVPYLVQKTKSTWPDLLVHGVLNGSAFILIALGVISG